MNSEQLKERFPNASDQFLELNGLAPRTSPAPSLAPGATPSKYRAQRTEYNGNSYHSKKEAAKAQELDLMVAAKEIDFYLRQVPFPLPGGIVYRADFVTFKPIAGPIVPGWPSWRIKVIEVKGMWTPASKNKWKQFRALYPNLEAEIC